VADSLIGGGWVGGAGGEARRERNAASNGVSCGCQRSVVCSRDGLETPDAVLNQVEPKRTLGHVAGSNQTSDVPEIPLEHVWKMRL
jgi:hypothetical protein